MKENRKKINWEAGRQTSKTPAKLTKAEQRELDNIRGWTKKDDKSRSFRRYTKGWRE